MEDFSIAGISIKAGERTHVQLEMAPLYDFTPASIPVEVIRGKQAGPVLFVCAAIHGDEINGVDILRRLLSHKRLRRIKGTLIAVPIVNVFGFNTKSRYLPDRRDLNRCFPGAADGSLTAQLAHVFMHEIVSKATHGIDLHTGAIHRSNVPQVRACLDDAETRHLAEAFGAPVLIHSNVRDGSLREAARERGVRMLLYEAGEALRFNDKASQIGVQGIFNVMQAIGMLEVGEKVSRKKTAFMAQSSYWLRATNSGMIRVNTALGRMVEEGALLGTITDPFGLHHFEIRAKQAGIVIGMSQLPLFNKGDAVFHIATIEKNKMSEIREEAQADTFVM